MPTEHTERKLSDKAGQYAEVVRQVKVPYFLGVCGEFVASLSPEEIQHVLYVQHDGWYRTAQEVSGVIYFREKNFSFEFRYLLIPAPLYPSTVSSGQPDAAEQYIQADPVSRVRFIQLLGSTKTRFSVGVVDRMCVRCCGVGRAKRKERGGQ